MAFQLEDEIASVDRLPKLLFVPSNLDSVNRSVVTVFSGVLNLG